MADGKSAPDNVSINGKRGGELRLRGKVEHSGARRVGETIEQCARSLFLAGDVFADAARCIEDEGEGEAFDSGGEERGLYGSVVCEKCEVGGGESGDRSVAAVCNDDWNGDEIGANFDNLIVSLRVSVQGAQSEQES